MRIVTWNCYRGECLARAAELAPLNADIIVLQECARPIGSRDVSCVWFGENPIQGVGVIARNGYTLERGPVNPAVSHSVFPVIVRGPLYFHLLAVWALPKPTYVRAIDAGVAAYRDFVKAAPSMVLGDFNSHSCFDARNQSWTHTMLVQKLRDEYGLVSAFHSYSLQKPSSIEEPTFYHRRKEEAPFHIDYCFVPQSWTPHIRQVHVGSYQDWNDKSDHRPLLAEVALPRTNGDY